MSPYLLDSGFLYAFINKKESRHVEVSGIFDIVHEPIVLPIPAITESCLPDFARFGRRGFS